MSDPTSRFYDDIAPLYDGAMEKGFITRIISRRFQECLLAQFQTAAKVLDVGCGCGTDAIFLGSQGVDVYGFDFSEGMIRVARQKAAAAGLEARVEFANGNAIDLSGLPNGRFDGAYSNFNVLNHLPDLGAFARALSEKLQPGSPVVLTMMNRVCLPEALGYLARLRWATAARKLWSRQHTLSLPMRLYFPAEAARAFEPYFTWQGVQGFGLLVPPAQLYTGHSFRRCFDRLAALERPLLRRFPLYNLCDIYTLILKRK